ncbi:ROK family transcriptional regulator [Actinoplanes lobatus]|uniref:Putative NBD/HSP70 family sugar kinase/putative transcriptional regulator n=1 Tax=Actinoplanes lobatus TaxID=113568 RepID=A0A7W7MHU0_9ACTN|nr:ROK family transcriptional regulator [Actinoplanes lobatus]MBB4750663.1 putative NBD/HSP70 family sugar kinase/putative transcriptional regulator [Actinoplanes lobatus]
MSTTGGVHALVRRAHEERVLAILREHGTLSRAQIAARAGLSRTTLSEITGELLGRGAIVVTATDARRRAGSGRPAELLALDPRSGQFLGVDLGHTRARVVVADAAHEIIASGMTAYPARTSPAGRIRAALALVDRLSREQGIGLSALQGVGVGVTGPSPAGAARAEVLAAFRERFAAPVLVDNNTRFAALAEAGTTDARDVLYVRLADGIGGGLVVGGRLVTGAGGVAGEFGHVRASGDADCRCGKRGCLETVAAVGPALAAAGVATLDELAAVRESPRAAAATDRIGAAVGRVLAAAALILDPELIVIGGPLVSAVPEIVDRAAAVIAAERPARGGAGPAVRAARLGDDDGARGAVAAIFRQSPLLADYAIPTEVNP